MMRISLSLQYNGPLLRKNALYRAFYMGTGGVKRHK